jgi:lipoprotein-anchoring transpeptidase ErfK/SrfK
LLAALGLTACTGEGTKAPSSSTDTSNAKQPAQGRATATDTSLVAASQLHLVVDTSEKQLSVVRGGDTVKTYPIAVGTAKYPTPLGAFTIHQIDFNPDWTPPDGEWAKNKEYEKPGSKENPMGRARIIYQMPYTIHGTKDLNSLGEADSHGSIRMANNHVVELARLIMQESGTGKPESWYGQVLADSTKMVSVELTKKIPLTNRE